MPGPSNLYGLANPVTNPVVIEGNITANIPANTATAIFPPQTMAAPSSGYFYPMVYLAFYVGWLTPLPTDFHIGFNINGGSLVAQYQIDTALYQASLFTGFFPVLAGTPSNTAWAGAGSVINITANPSTNPVSIRSYSNQAVIALYRAQDQ